ncbi:hypothetical protein CMUS01_14941 [Colletotrichum musicola]|uniref:Uncharacterized protein n=1 Tax=Colletotrichum musicola TaxID=2175873 RepID=A0A8H6J055_9PEZI|nr:hypothetical protein CMUS01_14941 [Colletotrichum musicola]
MKNESALDLGRRNEPLHHGTVRIPSMHDLLGLASAAQRAILLLCRSDPLGTTGTPLDLFLDNYAVILLCRFAFVGLSSLPAKIAGSVADASATGAELRSSVSRSEHVTGLGAGLDIQRR